MGKLRPRKLVSFQSSHINDIKVRMYISFPSRVLNFEFWQVLSFRRYMKATQWNLMLFLHRLLLYRNVQYLRYCYLSKVKLDLHRDRVTLTYGVFSYCCRLSFWGNQAIFLAFLCWPQFRINVSMIRSVRAVNKPLEVMEMA